MKTPWFLLSAVILSACGTTAEFQAVESECSALLLKQYPAHGALKVYAREKEEFQGRVFCHTVIDTHYMEVEDHAPPRDKGGKDGRGGGKNDRPPPPRTKTVRVDTPRQQCDPVPEKFYQPKQVFETLDLYANIRQVHVSACTAQNCMARYGNAECKK